METREVARLKVNPNNPRGEVAVDDSLRELADSIRSQGVLQPILITTDDVIVCGHRRAKACELAGISTIPVIVRSLSAKQQLHVMLIENLQREDLTALQTARAYKVLVEHGLSVSQIAKATGFNSKSISTHLDILSLHPDLWNAFDGDRALPLGCISYLLELSPAQQLSVAVQARDNGWTVRQIVRVIKKPATVAASTEPSPNGHKRHEYGTHKPYLERIWDRIEDGCYTPDSVQECSECGRHIFPTLSHADIKKYMQQLVDQGRAEWRRARQGSASEDEREDGYVGGMICVPVDMPSGSDYGTTRRMVD